MDIFRFNFNQLNLNDNFTIFIQKLRVNVVDIEILNIEILVKHTPVIFFLCNFKKTIIFTVHTKESWIFSQVCYLYFELRIALCCVSGLMAMSINLTENVVTMNYQCIFHFSMDFFSYSVTSKHHTHSSVLKLTIHTNVVTCVTLWWCLLICCCLNSQKNCPLRCHSAWLVVCMTRKPHDRKCLTAWKSCCVEICVCLGFSEDTTGTPRHSHNSLPPLLYTFIAEKIIIHFKGATQ